jgi:excisionase family DNA binding protein
MQEIEVRMSKKVNIVPMNQKGPLKPDHLPPLFPPDDTSKTITLKRLAELSGIEETTLRNWLRKGTIPGAFQYNERGHWKFRREMLEPWWEDLLTRHLNRNKKK